MKNTFRNLLRGASYLLSIVDVFSYKNSKSGPEEDKLNLGADWKKVGDYIRKGLRTYDGREPLSVRRIKIRRRDCSKT